MFPYIFFIGLVALSMGILNVLGHFAAPALAPVLLNLAMIASVLLISPHLDRPVFGLAAGVMIGGLLQLLLQIPFLIRNGLRFWKGATFYHPGLKRIGVLMLPAVLGAAVYQINIVIGTLLASFLTAGSISHLYYADRLVQFPLGIFAIAISTAALPSLATEAAKNDLNQFRSTLNHALCLVFFITLPSMAGLIILGRPIVRVLFERGAFDAHATLMTDQALLYYTLGLWAFSGIRVMVSAFYALQDTKTPVKVAAMALAGNLVLSLALMGPLKHGGLALALSLASALQFLLLGIFLKRKTSVIRIRPVLISVTKSAAAALLMGLGVYYFHVRWFMVGAGERLSTLVIHLAALIIIGIIIYFAAARLFGCRELAAIKEIFSGRRRR